MSKLTKWFPADVKPIHIGVYEVKSPYPERCFAYFDGRDFRYRAWMGVGSFSTLQKAVRHAFDAKMISSTLTDYGWRGLANKPKVK